MIIGILKEIKTEENRVCMTPAGVEALVHDGHQVLVQANAGVGSNFTDSRYQESGGEIVGAANKSTNMLK